MALAEEWISLRKFARARGVALSAVQKAIATKRVTAVRRIDPNDPESRITGIELHAATEQWNRNTDPSEAAKSGQVIPPPAVQELELEQRGGQGGEARDSSSAEKGARDPGFNEERTKRELVQRQLLELEYARELGAVVDAGEVRQSAHRRYRAIRDKLLNIPDRVASILAAEKEPARVHAALTVEIKRVLNELSDDAQAEAARGAEERVAA